MTLSALVAALTIVAPPDGVTVPTLKPAQREYLSGTRSTRFVRMDNAADRSKLLLVGSAQQPLHLEWTGETNVVYLLEIAREGTEGQLFAVSNRTDAWITNLEIGSRFYWSVRPAGSLEMTSASFVTDGVAPRLLRAEGVRNFRDLGGWRTADGQRVRQNMIFRSAGLRDKSKSSGNFIRRRHEPGARRVTDAGIETLRKDFGIRTDIELRTLQDMAGVSASALGPDVRWVNVPMGAYANNPLGMAGMDTEAWGREPFAKLFRVFAKRESYPVLMHCSGGRDRTGTLAFLLNGLLGVAEDDLCRDWEASVFSDAGMKFVSTRIGGLIAYLKTLPGDTLRDKVESYAKGCGITAEEIASFRAIMLEPL